MINRYMRLIVMFDLPVKTKNQVSIATKFRGYLLDNGYIMMQYSVYTRICKNHSDYQKHSNRIRVNVPHNGNVRMFAVTEKQFEDMEILCGERKDEEEYSIEPMIVFD